jgi:hypothetical protein
MLEAIRSSETSVHTRATRRNIPEDGILHSRRRDNLKSYIALNGWTLKRRRNVFPVRYEFGSYIPEDGILHSHFLENLKSHIALNGRTLKRRRNVFPVRYELGSYIPEDGILHSRRRDNLKCYPEALESSTRCYLPITLHCSTLQTIAILIANLIK